VLLIVADRHESVLDVRRATQLTRNAVGDESGLLEACAFRRANVNLELSHIVLGLKALRNRAPDGNGRHQ
jgi:hypothetical protein